MILIAALAQENGVIGQGDSLPWDIPDEYRQFLDFVEGQTVLMGRRSWQIFGDDLTSAHNVIVSRSLPSRDDVHHVVVPTLEAGLERARRFSEASETLFFVAGGASIYRQTLPSATGLYLSYVKGDFEGDAYFPDFDAASWWAVEHREHPAFDFVRYRRRTAA